jgi:hypothetical protein
VASITHSEGEVTEAETRCQNSDVAICVLQASEAQNYCWNVGLLLRLN